MDSDRNQPTEIDSTLKAYLDIGESFVRGLYRFWGAEAASARLMCALIEFHASGRKGLDGPAATILQHLGRIEQSSYDSMVYVMNISHLVYATTLLDTFLSDTLLFLYLLYPHAMGRNAQVPLRTVINASSRNDALTQAAISKTREISYLPFPARVDFMRETFGLKIDLTPTAAEALNHYPSIRNTAVHDQGLYEIRLDENGSVASKRKTCIRHPTLVTEDDVSKAAKAYENVVMAIAQGVFVQVLKHPDHPAVQHFLRRHNASSPARGRNQ